MSEILKNLISIGITAGLSDRDNFVKQVSEIIQEYQEDPGKSKQWAGALAEYLENVKTNINTEQAIKNAISAAPIPSETNINELTLAIRQLTAELQKRNEKT